VYCRHQLFPYPQYLYKNSLLCVANALIFYGIGRVREVVFPLAILFLLLFFGTGMGDIKLMTLIVVTHTSNTMDFLGFVFLLAIVHIVVLAGIHRRIPTKIPLAPSIFIGLATYLATR